MKSIALKPRQSEKTYALYQAENTYVFDIAKTVNKLQVKQAVSAQFDVTVEDVRVIVAKGKAKRSNRKGGRPIAGRRVDVKKAYVKLKDGDSIPIFAAIEESEKKAEEAAKKAEAKAKKKDKK